MNENQMRNIVLLKDKIFLIHDIDGITVRIHKHKDRIENEATISGIETTVSADQT